MKINQYMCNMKVLAGLFLANDTSLGAFLGAFLYQAGMDMINFRNRTNSLINFNLIISFKEMYIDVYISKREPEDRTIYDQMPINSTSPVYSYLKVFLQ